MNRTVLLLGLVLADFLALTGWALYHHGYVGLFEAAVATPAGIQVFSDLVIALSLFTVWMWRDARARGIAVFPFMVLTATLGSIGALAYLLRRELAGEVLPDADVDGTDVIAIGVVVGTQHHDAAPAFRQGLQPREHFRIGVTRGGAA